MRAAETLVIVGNAEGVLVVERAIELAEGCVLVEAAGERTSGCLDLCRESGIIGEKTRREIIDGGTVIDRQRLVADLTLEISEIEPVIRDEGAAHGTADLLAAVMRLGNSLLLVDLVEALVAESRK